VDVLVGLPLGPGPAGAARQVVADDGDEHRIILAPDSGS
jgi:hypothetical protein